MSSTSLLSSFTVQAGAAGQLTYDLTSPRFIRPPFRGVYATLTYANTGSTDIPAPLFDVVSENARVRLADETGFATGGYELLGVNPNGLAGVLPPGAHGSIDLYFEPINGTPLQQVTFEAFVAGGDVAVNWDSLRDDLRPQSFPADAWDAVFTNFKAAAGTTGASYAAMLADNASYLSQFGPVSPGVGRLLQFEFDQADDFGAISGHYATGAFGRGTPAPFSATLSADAFGTVTIFDGLSSSGFVKLANGSYRGTGSELSKLSFDGAAHTFTLDDGAGTKTIFRESDGHIVRVPQDEQRAATRCVAKRAR